MTPNSISPWRDIWFRPRRAIGYVVDTNPEYFMFALAIATTFVRAIQKSSNDSLGDKSDLPTMIVTWTFAAFLMGPLGLLINGAIAHWTGKKLGGKCEDAARVRAALAWGAVPYLLTLIPLGCLYALMGFEMFTTATPKLDSAGDATLFVIIGLTVLNIVFYVWSWITSSHALGQVFGFSAWRGFAVQVLPALCVITVIVVGVVASKHSPEQAVRGLLNFL